MQKIKQISKEEARAMGHKRRRAEEKNKAKRAANTNPYSPNFAQAEAMEDWVEAERAACLAHYLYLLDGEGMEDVRRLRDRAKKMRLAHEALWPEGKAPTLAMCARRFARPLEAFNVHLNAKAHSTPQAPKEAQS